MTESARRRPYAPRMPREQRQQQVLDAAIAIIARDGYEGVSIDAIAKEAGVTRPVVYGAYDGLGALLLSLLDRQQVRAMDQLLGALPAELDVDGAGEADAWLAHTVRALVEQIRTDPITWRPILLPPHGTPEAVRSRIDADRQQIRDHVAGLVTELLGDQVDSEVLSHAVVAVMEHFGRLILEEPDRFEAERLITSVRLVVGGLLESATTIKDRPEASGSISS